MAGQKVAGYTTIALTLSPSIRQVLAFFHQRDEYRQGKTEHGQ